MDTAVWGPVHWTILHAVADCATGEHAALIDSLFTLLGSVALPCKFCRSSYRKFRYLLAPRATHPLPSSWDKPDMLTVTPYEGALAEEGMLNDHVIRLHDLVNDKLDCQDMAASRRPKSEKIKKRLTLGTNLPTQHTFRLFALFLAKNWDAKRVPFQGDGYKQLWTLIPSIVNMIDNRWKWTGIGIGGDWVNSWENHVSELHFDQTLTSDALIDWVMIHTQVPSIAQSSLQISLNLILACTLNEHGVCSNPEHYNATTPRV